MSLTPPIPHQPNTTLSISNLQPHCHAGDRIRLWKPKTVRMFCSTQGVPIPLNQEDVKPIEGVSLNSATFHLSVIWSRPPSLPHLLQFKENR